MAESKKEPSEPKKDKFVQFSTNVEEFSNFIKYIRCTGKDADGNITTLMKDVIFYVTKTTLLVYLIDETKTVIVIGKMKIKGNKQGKIPIFLDDLEIGLSLFNPSDKILIHYEENNIAIRRSEPLVLQHIFRTVPFNSIKNDVDMGLNHKLNPKNIIKKTEDGYYKVLDEDLILKLTVSGGQLLRVVKDGEQLKYYTFPLIYNEGTLHIDLDDQQTGKYIKREVEIGDILNKTGIERLINYYHEGFGNVVGALKSSDLCSLWMGDRSNLMINLEGKASKGMDIKYVIAPYTESTEEED